MSERQQSAENSREELSDYRTVSRRSFLATGGAATMATGLAGGLQPALAVEQTPKKVRLGIAGGNFGATFQFHEHPHCIVEAVTDLIPERRTRLMKAYRCQKSYESLEEMVLDDRIDAIAIFTDGPLHTQHVELAMRHGKHAMSAVPAAWGSLDDCRFLRETVEKHGLIYMLCETGYYQPEVIAAREFYKEGQFGELFYCESEYQHPRLDRLYVSGGKRTWRYGVAPMHYPTHNTAKLISVTGERLTSVSCQGWGDDSPVLTDNAYDNPFWNESALFRTNRDHAFRLCVWWLGAFRFAQRAEWIGSKMSLFMEQANGQTPVMVRTPEGDKKDSTGFAHGHVAAEPYNPPVYWKTDRLPDALRHNSGHWGSHCFLTHEFIDAIVSDRKPAIDLYEALAYTAPGIVAHESALRKGELMNIPSFDLE
jgi:predicted dehydrogenase